MAPEAGAVARHAHSADSCKMTERKGDTHADIIIRDDVGECILSIRLIGKADFILIVEQHISKVLLV